MRKLICFLMLTILTGCMPSRIQDLVDIMRYGDYVPERKIKENSFTSFIAVTSEPSDAEIYLGEKFIGRTPIILPIKVNYLIYRQYGISAKIENLYINDETVPLGKLQVKKILKVKSGTEQATYIEKIDPRALQPAVLKLTSSYPSFKDIALLRHQYHFELERNNIEEMDMISDSIAKEYYPNGQLLWELNYKDNKREGLNKIYYWNGNLMAERNYKDGRLEGLVKEYYENGKFKSERNYKNGKLEGISKEYYYSGDLLSELNYRYGKLEGIGKIYNYNGQLIQEANYKDNKLESISKSYYFDGELEKEASYKNGKLEGTLKKYEDRSGNWIMWETNYKDGHQDGLCKYYSYKKKGVIDRIDTYKKGKVINRKLYDEKGKLISEKDYQ
ncbi:MAG: toxin-antitoxin system YwqK family antitoxin [Candidatus Omnitrophota bacterium]